MYKRITHCGGAKGNLINTGQLVWAIISKSNILRRIKYSIDSHVSCLMRDDSRSRKYSRANSEVVKSLCVANYKANEKGS